MVVVAIAGTGGVSRTVLDAIDERGEHKVIILSRTVSSPDAVIQSDNIAHTIQAVADEPRRIAVDYGNVDHIKRVLQENKAEVVVSGLLLVDDGAAQSQKNLMRAAAQSGTVDRFIPTEYYIDFHKPIPGSDLFFNLQLDAEEELSRHPQLTWTLVRVGIFLDHFTRPYNSKTSHIAPFWTLVDMEHEKCVFPGDGSYPLVLTHSMDFAAYIDRLVGLPADQWPRESLVASNKLQVKDLDAIIKKATGKQFQVTYDSEEAIRKGQITPLPSNEPIFADPASGHTFHLVEQQIMLSMFSHAHDLPGKNLAELFPDVRPTEIEDFFRAGWAIKQRAKSG